MANDSESTPDQTPAEVKAHSVLDLQTLVQMVAENFEVEAHTVPVAGSCVSVLSVVLEAQ